MTADPDPLEALAEEGETALEDGEYEIALETFDELLKQDPEHWGAHLRRAECLHLLWRSAQALEAVRDLTPAAGEEDDPDRVELEGTILEAMGRFDEADRLFAEAHRLEPEDMPLPVRLTPDDFKALVDKVLASLPRVIREAVLEVPVLVEPKPTPAMAEHAPAINPEVLGLFVGTSVGEKLRGGGGYGDVVLLFQKNLERAGRNRQEVSKEMKITLLHEYGHYLGFDEEELEHLGLG
ncbi:MAG TPA: metallopeptidase family protein [Candidatus Eisenbacteria bacterium]|nr:metallopeptidase family protein [Candidatus Eisenbacteria bacterium]